MAAAQLIELEGASVSLKGEMVSLTGLWKAAGSDPSKQPAKWRELPSAKEFAAHIADVVLRKSEDELFSVTRGGKTGGVTWANWHVAMSYARYLDPAFAVKCNEIVRAHMERRLAPASDFPAELLEMIKRTDGIVRMLAHKVTTIEKAVTASPEPVQPDGFTITVMPTKRSAA